MRRAGRAPEHRHGFGLDPDDDVDSPEGFAAWVHQRVRLTHPAGQPCGPVTSE
jgi:hypothetical protein